MERFKRELIGFIPAFIVYLVIDVFVFGAMYIAGINENGTYNLIEATKNFAGIVSNPFEVIASLSELGNNIQGFLTISFYLLIGTIIAYIYYKIKNKANYDYEGEENGSSEWSKNGEEFKRLPDGSEILNRKEGFILSKDHYLGIDQRKVKINKNILVIGGSGARKICLLC